MAKYDGNFTHKRVKGKISTLKDYHPDLDESNELEDPNMYQQLIGILRLACELDQIYILNEVVFLPRNLCNPIEEHIDTVFQIFKYLNVKRKYIPRKLGFENL